MFYGGRTIYYQFVGVLEKGRGHYCSSWSLGEGSWSLLQLVESLIGVMPIIAELVVDLKRSHLVYLQFVGSQRGFAPFPAAVTSLKEAVTLLADHGDSRWGAMPTISKSWGQKGAASAQIYLPLFTSALLIKSYQLSVVSVV